MGEVLMEALLNLSKINLNGSQRRILDVIWSYTICQGKESAEIPNSLIQSMTGIKKNHVKREMALLIDSNIIIIVKAETRTSPRVIKFNTEFSNWIHLNRNSQKKIKNFLGGIQIGDTENDDFCCKRLSQGHDYIGMECQLGWVALYIAVGRIKNGELISPIQPTPEEAIREAKKEKWKSTGVLREVQLTSDIIVKAKRMILDKPKLTMDELERKVLVNRYKLVDGMRIRR